VSGWNWHIVSYLLSPALNSLGFLLEGGQLWARIFSGQSHSGNSNYHWYFGLV